MLKGLDFSGQDFSMYKSAAIRLSDSNNFIFRANPVKTDRLVYSREPVDGLFIYRNRTVCANPTPKKHLLDISPPSRPMKLQSSSSLLTEISPRRLLNRRLKGCRRIVALGAALAFPLGQAAWAASDTWSTAPSSGSLGHGRELVGRKRHHARLRRPLDL